MRFLVGGKKRKKDSDLGEVLFVVFVLWDCHRGGGKEVWRWVEVKVGESANEVETENPVFAFCFRLFLAFFGWVFFFIWGFFDRSAGARQGRFQNQ